MEKTLKEFRDFLMQGNLIELAVAFVMAIAFKAVIDAVVSGFVEPLISMFGGKPDLSGNYFTINDAQFGWGLIVTQLLNLVITGAAVFFFIVKPVKKLMDRMKRGEITPPEPLAPELSPEARRFLEEMTAALQRLS
jgi:large conductance mechanosensitive channel